MSGVFNSWDLKEVYLVVGGERIGGFGDDDAIQIEPNADAVTMTTGADGETVGSRTNDRSHVVTLSLMQTSQGYRDLYAQFVEQQGEQRISRRAFRLYDANTGFVCRSDHAIFLNNAIPTFSKEAGSIEIRIGLPSPDFEVPLSIPS